MTLTSNDYILIQKTYGSPNYAPLDVVVDHAQGVWVWDIEGEKYLDFLSGYSALNFGHRHPKIIEAAKRQLDRVTVTSRSFYNDELAMFSKELSEFTGMEMVLPMNSGAEAVESAIKCARRWGYQVKGVDENRAEIICFKKNFAGRTTTIISFGDSPESRRGFGPYTEGFKLAEFGSLDSVESLVTRNTVAILFEPIQGEGGIIVPPDGFLRGIREICDANNILMIADEVQTGFGRTGYRFACDAENVKPDLMTLGKALGGGIVAISALVGKKDLLSVFTPGSHGSTFGGNPFACAIARASMRTLLEENLVERSRILGERLLSELKSALSSVVKDIRGRGLFIGVEFNEASGTALKYCNKLKNLGVLTKDTRKQTMRIAPPLVISEKDLNWGKDKVIAAILE